ncbi:MAG: uroporphyrinogen-III synthase [Gammaproteobacteria bacterium]|jgi:uroporphyrinogen-III synthase|nr:uroporphyrinogen-III synthase [Gammaproteobacteria bacterium]
MIFINTRPQGRAEALSQALQQQYIEVINLPLLHLSARPWSAELASLYAQLPNTHIIVVVSPTAVEVGMAYLAQSHLQLQDLQHIRWVAVGEKTAEVLREYGVHSDIPQVETSEGMLSLASLQNLAAGTQIAFWRGEGGRQFMMQTLLDQGMQVHNFVLYQRECPASSVQKMAAVRSRLIQTSEFWMMISSEASWLNWLMLIQHDATLLNKGHYWVLGDRLEQILLDYQAQHHTKYKILKLTNLKTELILQQIMRMQGKL